MTERVRFALAYEEGAESMAALCRRLGISDRLRPQARRWYQLA